MDQIAELRLVHVQGGFIEENEADKREMPEISRMVQNRLESDVGSGLHGKTERPRRQGGKAN